MVYRIALHRKAGADLYALVDDEDAAQVTGYRWWLSPSGRLSYVRTTVRDRKVYLHTVLTGWPRVDHANGDTLDNQRANLRPASPSQNGANSRKQEDCTSRYKGVNWHRGAAKWMAGIRINRKGHYLGLFTDEAEAARAYDAAARAAWGEYARLNFP